MKNRILKCTGLLISLVFVFSLFPPATAADWSDDFTSDTILSGDWTVVWGEWSVEDGILQTYVDDETIQRVAHPSNQTVGTWSFDINMSHNVPFERCTVWFMTNGTDSPDENYGYGLRINQDSIYLIKLQGEWDNDATISGAVYFSPEPFHNTWTHYDVTRNSTGGFNVFINKTLPAEPDFSVVDTVYDYSTRFLIDFRGMTARVQIDNIVVESPTTTTTTTTTTTSSGPATTNGGNMDTTLLVVGAGVVGVVIVVTVVFVRRR